MEKLRNDLQTGEKWAEAGRKEKEGQFGGSIKSQSALLGQKETEAHKPKQDKNAYQPGQAGPDHPLCRIHRITGDSLHWGPTLPCFPQGQAGQRGGRGETSPDQKDPSRTTQPGASKQTQLEVGSGWAPCLLPLFPLWESSTVSSFYPNESQMEVGVDQ